MGTAAPRRSGTENVSSLGKATLWSHEQHRARGKDLHNGVHEGCVQPYLRCGDGKKSPGRLASQHVVQEEPRGHELGGKPWTGRRVSAGEDRGSEGRLRG